MNLDNFNQQISRFFDWFSQVLVQSDTYVQLVIAILAIGFAWIVTQQFKRFAPVLEASKSEADAPLRGWGRYTANLGLLFFPILSILLLRLSVEISQYLLQQDWLIYTILAISALYLLNLIVDKFVFSPVASRWIKWFGMPIVILHFLGILDELIQIFEALSFSAGNIQISAYGVIRAIVFGILLIWFARILVKSGREIIARQKALDSRTREVSIKLYQVAVFFIVFLVILQIMGINLTALAVFGGALGIGIGFGLQSIASNFISGIIILLDRSVTVGDYVELNGGQAGYVRNMDMRSTTLETFDGKDIMVPNEKFIVETFTNYTHKDQWQRYRVDFSVAYNTDVRKLVDTIKNTVADHPQVLSGEDYAIEIRPDCEIDSFGDSGINMFVEFWMEGIDDGKNRVGGDLLLMIYEAMREHGYQIPFPQREVRILDQNFSVGPVKKQDPK